MDDIETILEWVGGASGVIITIMTALCCCKGYCVACCKSCGCCGGCKCCEFENLQVDPNITDKGNGIKEYHMTEV